ncbi:hypothetical protein OROGR_002428 [Orobanche gracilis]
MEDTFSVVLVKEKKWLRSSVPKFGNWESEDGVPYTAYFDKARKTRVGVKIINPNDPQDPEMFPSSDTSPLAPPSNPPPQKPRSKMDEPIGTGPERRERSKEDADFRQFSNSPARGDKTSNESSYGGRAQRPARTPRRSDRLEQGFDRSPLHPQYQANVTEINNGSPAWEGKNHDSSHGTPGRTRLKSTARGDDSPDRAAAVPKFGKWDVTNPEDENFTRIFNKVREERNTKAGSGTPKHSSYGARPQQAKEPKGNPAVFAGRTRDDRIV